MTNTETTPMQQEIASAAVRVAPSAGLATWSMLNWPWGQIAGMVGTIYTVLMISFLIYDRFFKAKT